MPTDPQALCQTTEAYLHAQIPITRAMGVGIESYEAHTGHLVLTAPLETNHNHLGTAFGGSLSALCTLAGYALLWLDLEGQSREEEAGTHTSKPHVVVKESTISYLHPVKEPLIRVVCERPDAALMQSFHRQFTQKGKARIQLTCTVTENAQTCVRFTGTYVAVR
ncbi:thioesterase domain-containing protein [Roseimicrobium gellanilyticum]|uniref:Thioesterase domain-containing protein n=1 Tax=Roseimicrobium gellanilyticum TaxID=748857 RepID=A0A366HFT0_9BACT|nr:YiiD C-terminal domain-containing protein [Roseimicrobium gellanilyticum]RBP41368.1 thioesterase domain-containing protein [Roseimicrobium gellanilyticum]